jgi:hypothetical protein
MDKYFDNIDELHSTAPSGNNKGQRVFEIVIKIKFVFGKKTKDRKTRKAVKPIVRATFKKKSIFFQYLPYWKERHVTHDRWYAHLEERV